MGWRQVYPGRFDPNHTVKLVAEEEVKALAGVPTMLYMLLTAPELPKYLAKIREVKPIFVVGGAALPKELKAYNSSISISGSICAVDVRQRLEVALASSERPSLEEVLERVSRRGVLRGPVDWVFEGWALYVEYATREIAKTFPLSEEEKRQLLQFGETLTRLLRETQRQTRERLTALYNAVVEGRYKTEGRRLYAPDGTWMYLGKAVYVPLSGLTASAHFPDLLKLPPERLELFQLGWRASDESTMDIRPVMGTTQPWQVFAWAAVRFGVLSMRIATVNTTYEGISVAVHLKAKSWRQRWSKEEAVDLAADHLRRGEWAPMLTMWLGDGETKRNKILRGGGDYELTVATKEPWRLGVVRGSTRALVAKGKEAFAKLKEAAGVYGELLDLLKAHKWIDIKLLTDDGFKAAYKSKAKKRKIDLLRAKYGRADIPIEDDDVEKPNAVVVAGIAMRLQLLGGNGGSIIAIRTSRNPKKVLAMADRLESAGFRPNISKMGPRHMVYITTADLLRLAERDESAKKAIAVFLVEKAKNGTLRQRAIAEKILKRHPSFSNHVSTDESQ
jgi:hypothetical protein